MTERFYKLPQDVAARRDLPPAAKVLHAVIGDHMGANGCAWPGTRKLAEETGQNRGTVLRSTERLEAAGLLTVDRRGNGRVNHYRLARQSGRGTQPVGKPDRWWSENPTGTGRKTQP